ncbi:hypothetical protein [Embleya hyalina]|uniref:Lipoprotein n=1 Tax=Embleya hyalina TaxID=516124 RepID=A0A401YNF8_9ACTN|nr:hypothetical protein [Embleya hyalina]GCD96136.1 hypothetical protein EHYA_03820 [Embleya hyalina]
MQRTARLATTAALAATVLLATGCGGDGDDDKGTKPAAAPASAGSGPVAGQTAAAPDTAALETAVRAYTEHLFKGNGAGAYPILSTRCQDKIGRPGYDALAAEAKKTYGALTIKSIKVDQMSGDMARASYDVGVPALERKGQPWTREGGTWRWDAC